MQPEQPWILVLRAYGSEIHVIEAHSLDSLDTIPKGFALRLRFNPDMRLFTFKCQRTNREVVFAAAEQLSQDELRKLYNLPQHPLSL